MTVLFTLAAQLAGAISFAQASGELQRSYFGIFFDIKYASGGKMKIRVTITVDESIMQEVEMAADDEKRSISNMIEIALIRYFKQRNTEEPQC